MKRFGFKFAGSVAMATLLTWGTSVAPALAATDDSVDDSINDMVNSLLGSNQGQNDTQAKRETVYVISDANGAPKKITVSDQLKNGAKSNDLADKTTLSNVHIRRIDGVEPHLQSPA